MTHFIYQASYIEWVTTSWTHSSTIGELGILLKHSHIIIYILDLLLGASEISANMYTVHLVIKW